MQLPELPATPERSKISRLSRYTRLITSVFIGVTLTLTVETTATAQEPPTPVSTEQTTKEPDLSSYRLPFEGMYQITQGPSIRTINGEVCDSTEHTTHQGLAKYAVDFLVPANTPLFASQAGEVVHADWKASNGIAVLILHDDGLTSWYSHLSQAKVVVGQKVGKGEFIGLSGKTGASQAHLHWEVRDSTNSSVSVAAVPGLEFYGGPEDSCSFDERFEGYGEYIPQWQPTEITAVTSDGNKAPTEGPSIQP